MASLFLFDILEKGFVMKINTESKNYATIRSAISFSSFFGGCLAFDSVMIPFTKAVLSGKLRILRPFAYLGTYGLSLCVGSIAAGGVDWAVDTTVDAINKEPENDIHEELERWYTETGSTKNATPREEMDIINDFVADAKIFEFKSEEQAKSAAEKLAHLTHRYDFCDIANYCACIGVQVPYDIYDVALKYGWTKDTLGHLAVEEVRDGEWMLDAVNYQDISNAYELYRNEQDDNSKEN